MWGKECRGNRSGVHIATKRGMLLYVDASKQIPFCLKVSLRTPGGKGARLQIINSVTVKQKSRTYLSLLLDVSLLLRGLAAVFVAQTFNHPKPFNWMFTCYLFFKIDYCRLWGEMQTCKFNTERTRYGILTQDFSFCETEAFFYKELMCCNGYFNCGLSLFHLWQFIGKVARSISTVVKSTCCLLH